METLIRSSDHLREALDLRVVIDEAGKSKVINKKKLVLIGIRRKGDKGFKLKGLDF